MAPTVNCAPVADVAITFAGRDSRPAGPRPRENAGPEVHGGSTPITASPRTSAKMITGRSRRADERNLGPFARAVMAAWEMRGIRQSRSTLRSVPAVDQAIHPMWQEPDALMSGQRPSRGQ